MWGGPQFRYPVTQETFLADVKLSELKSYSLINEANELIAFGQYYLRVGRCHLGRLAVTPKQRAKGFGKLLIHKLMGMGCDELKVKESSLFVYELNTYAVEVYKRLGFELTPYPEYIPIEHCLYMVKAFETGEYL